MSRDTRAEILAVASERFTEQGYEATSLREIAERLDLTKAALYYHFPSKEQILRALLQPAFSILGQLLDRLETSADVDDWAAALDWIVAALFENLDFFRLIERNRSSVEEISRSFDEMQEHLRMHERVEAAAHRVATDVREEVRMMAALGAVTAFDDWAPRLLAETPPDVLADELSGVVRAILRVPDPATAG